MAIDVNVASTLSELSNTFGVFGDNWKGTSFTSISGKVESFASDFGGKIDEQIGKFNEALSLLETYNTVVADLRKAENELKIAQSQSINIQEDAAKQAKDITAIKDKIDKLTSNKLEIKNQIEAALESVIGGKLDSVETKSYESSFFGKKVDYTDDANWHGTRQDGNMTPYNFSKHWNNGGDDTIDDGGCGVVAFYNPLDNMGIDVDLGTLANEFTDGGYHECGTVRASEAYKKIGAKYGVDVQSIGTDKQKLTEALDNGDLLIINASAGTEIGGKYGHYLNIRGYGNSKNEVLVYDQYGDTDYGHSGSWNTDYVLSQLNDAWVITRKQ